MESMEDPIPEREEEEEEMAVDDPGSESASSALEPPWPEPEPEPEPEMSSKSAAEKKRAKKARQKARQRAEEATARGTSGLSPRLSAQDGAAAGAPKRFPGRENGRLIQSAAQTEELAKLASEQIKIAELEIQKKFSLISSQPLPPTLEAERAALVARRNEISARVEAARAAQAEETKPLVKPLPPRMGPGGGARGWSPLHAACANGNHEVRLTSTCSLATHFLIQI